MNSILHTMIATGCMAGCYYIGYLLAIRKGFNPVVSGLLDKLEAEGFIRIELDKDGDKELVPISEIINATKDRRKT
tara:strand:- start:6 stop:233 length:228 start_codon:yes stop_codon:yes gene_type:complete